LEACREEFHRRLKVYHAWKTKNNKQSDKSNEVDERAPQIVVDNAAQQQQTQDTQKPAKLSQKKSSKFGDFAEQRYFRIPYVPPSEQNRDAKKHKKGWWYAHFDGKWIARQMEVHQDKEPILMLAGVDDMNMCELSLDEAGLTKKKGAEILEADFEDEWNKNGGREYLKNNFGQISSKYVLNSIQNGFEK
jgi:myosin-6